MYIYIEIDGKIYDFFIHVFHGWPLQIKITMNMYLSDVLALKGVWKLLNTLEIQAQIFGFPQMWFSKE